MAVLRFSPLWIAGSVLLAVSCKSAASATDQVLTAARQELGADVDVQKSPEGTYYLCVEPQKPASMPQALRFVVIDTSTLKILLKDSFLPGFVRWSGNATLEVLSMPGTLKNGEDIANYVRKIEIHPIN